MSLVASWVSGVTILGTGTEIYLYGTQYCFIFIAIFVSSASLHYITIPVLHELQVTSVYEVGERKQIRSTRILANFLFPSSAVSRA